MADLSVIDLQHHLRHLARHGHELAFNKIGSPKVNFLGKSYNASQNSELMVMEAKGHLEPLAVLNTPASMGESPHRTQINTYINPEHDNSQTYAVVHSIPRLDTKYGEAAHPTHYAEYAPLHYEEMRSDGRFNHIRELLNNKGIETHPHMFHYLFNGDEPEKVQDVHNVIQGMHKKAQLLGITTESYPNRSVNEMTMDDLKKFSSLFKGENSLDRYPDDLSPEHLFVHHFPESGRPSSYAYNLQTEALHKLK